MLGDDRFGAHMRNMDAGERARQRRIAMGPNAGSINSFSILGNQWDPFFGAMQDAGAEELQDNSAAAAHGMMPPSASAGLPSTFDPSFQSSALQGGSPMPAAPRRRRAVKGFAASAAKR